ncbi:hypothetical protein [Pontimicrobium sp. MEBiC01747]
MRQVTQIRMITFQEYQIYMDDTKDHVPSFEDYVNNVLQGELSEFKHSIDSVQCIDLNNIFVVYTLTI